MNIRLRVFPDTETLIFQCLEVLKLTLPALGTNDGVMLAGGRTPLEIYRRAAADLSRRSSAKAEGLSTKGVLFLSDERYVPVTDPQSNYGSIAPFFKVGQAGSPSYVIRVKTELPIEAAAQAFHEYLNRMQSVPLGLLGLGADGHTASLFNLSDASLRDERLAIPVNVEETSKSILQAGCPRYVPQTSSLPCQQRQDAASTFTNQRISVTPTLLHKVEKILILATGADKKAIIQTLLKKPETIPAGVALTGHSNVEIWTEQNI